jgi:hypothetical protein
MHVREFLVNPKANTEVCWILTEMQLWQAALTLKEGPSQNLDIWKYFHVLCEWSGYYLHVLGDGCGYAWLAHVALLSDSSPV